MLPGTMQAFTDASIYARTDGYLKRRLVDIGAHVRAGQLLAEIDTPSSISRSPRPSCRPGDRGSQRQAGDDDGGALPGLDQHRIGVAAGPRQRQRQPRGAPDRRGIGARQRQAVRAALRRHADRGALRRRHHGAQYRGRRPHRFRRSNAKELFHIAAVHKLRVFVSVPQVYSQLAQPGIAAELALKEFPGRTFNGKLARTAQSIDVASRTLLSRNRRRQSERRAAGFVCGGPPSSCRHQRRR